MNAPMENRTLLGSIAKNKILKTVLIAVFALSVIGNGVQGYFSFKKAKAYHALEAVVKSKSNCDKCPETAAPAETTPTTTTPKSRSSGSSSSDSEAAPSAAEPEAVIPPPPPPSD